MLGLGSVVFCIFLQNPVELSCFHDEICSSFKLFETHILMKGAACMKTKMDPLLPKNSACCARFNQAHRSDKAGEQKHVTICHMPPGHKLSSRHTLGCVRSGGSAAAASLQQVPSCPMLSPLSPDPQMSPSPPPPHQSEL